MSAVGPWSVPGQYIKATIRKDLVARGRLPEDPAGAAAGGLIDAAFELAVRRRFVPDCPVRDIALLVAGARRRHPDVTVPVLAAEALIRERLGEAAPTGDIDSDTATLAKVLVLATIVDELALYENELDELLAEAERLAEQRGHRLTAMPQAGSPPAHT
jgi:hypothetical protein